MSRWSGAAELARQRETLVPRAAEATVDRMLVKQLRYALALQRIARGRGRAAQIAREALEDR